MRLATIFFIVFLLCAAFISSSQKAEKPEAAIVEIVMLDGKGDKVGTALVPIHLRDIYSDIRFYQGTFPSSSTDYDVLEIPMKGGGEVYMIGIR